MSVVDYLEGVINDKLLYTENNREVHFCCPLCNDHKKRMYVNLSTGQFWCHNCQQGGSFPTFIQKIEGGSLDTAIKRATDIRGSVSVPERITDNIKLKMVGSVKLAKRAIALPEEFTLLDKNAVNKVHIRAINYLKKRMVTEADIKRHRMGVCSTGQYAERVIIPIINEGITEFWVARAISRKALKKEMSPSNEDYQISKSNVVFNLWQSAKTYGTTVICEGIFDALSFGDIGSALLGKALHEEQFHRILEYKYLLKDGVFIALDWDAREEALATADRLSKHMSVKIIDIPKELGDPNDACKKLGKRGMLQFIANAEEYSFRTALRRKLWKN